MADQPTIDRVRVHEVADDLRGTTHNLHDYATEAEQNDAGFLAALDDEVFECSQCGWWCDVGEHGKEDGACDECSPEDDDDG